MNAGNSPSTWMRNRGTLKTTMHQHANRTTWWGLLTIEVRIALRCLLHHCRRGVTLAPVRQFINRLKEAGGETQAMAA